MGHELDDTNGLGGLNSDDEARRIPKGDYINARNIRNAINSLNRGGTVTNLKGNLAVTKYLLPYNANVWPTGRNKCIGAVEDTKYNTVLAMIWNSLGKHQILRFFRNNTDPNNPFGEVQQVIQYNFGWTKRTRITSLNIVYGVQEAGEDSEETGDLLYWCDPVPKKINFTKGNVVGKEKCWDVFLPITVEGNISPTTTFTFRNFAGTTIHTTTVTNTSLTNSGHIIVQLFGSDWSIGIDSVIDLTGVTAVTLSGSNIAGNNTTWIISDVQYVFGTTVIVVVGTMTADDFNGSITYNLPIREREPLLEAIAQGINADTNSPVTAEACDCRLEFCEKVAGTVWTITSDQNAIIISPKNWYGSTLIDRFFDRCKWQPLNAPQGTFEKDANYEPNYVQRKVFQFRLEYDYDDLERSALGVWSQIPINNLGCDGTSDKSYNYIDVNFNDILIANAETLVLLKRIRFIARELNTGNDRAVISLEPCDFLDYRDGAWYCHFKFYNDIISSPIDAATAAKLFDNVPLESNAEQYAKNRLVEGGILEGYDAPECVKAKVQMEFEEAQNPALYDVTFYVRIITYGLSDGEVAGNNLNFYELFPSLEKYPFWNPYFTIIRGGIFHDITRTDDSEGGNFPFFGGGGFGTGSGGDFGIRAGMESTYDQRLPEGGFTIYLAGTPYFGITEQINVGLPVDSLGALDTSTSVKRNAIGAYLYAAPNKDLYSKVTIKVPAGEYIARVASHWCSFDDKLDKGFMYNLSAGTNYQKTSTNVWSTIPAGDDPVGINYLPEKEIRISVTGDIAHAGTFVIMDLAPPFDVDTEGENADFWQPINCYVYDSSPFSTDINDPNFNGTSVEKAIVFYTRNAYDSPNVRFRWGESAVTDHNGYFFGIGGVGGYGRFDPAVYQVNGLRIVESTLIYTGSLSDLFNKRLVPYNFDGISAPPAPFNIGLVYGVVSTTTANARLNCSTQIEGTVTDSNGNPIPNVLVIYENGNTAITQSDGGYTLIAWGDMLTPNLPNFSTHNPFSIGTGRTVDNLIFELGILCSPEYPNGQEYSPVNIDPINTNGTTTPPPYSPTAPYTIPDFIINENNNPAVKAHKRGGNYIYAGRGYDSAGRLCSCFYLAEIYVPFITEDIGKYGIEDFSGAVYPPSTFRYGKPSLKIILDSGTTFPSWMTSFQLMRTKDSIDGRYLQWVANQVTYISALQTTATPEVQTAFQNGDATAIRISLKNIIDYSAQNNNSLVSYQFQPGDRLRLIADRNLNYINGLNDFEVTSYDSTTQDVIIKPEGFNQEIQSGSLFQLINPKSVSTDDQQIFWEVGEVIKVTNGIPATFSKTLTNGDTYWRGRLITVNDEGTKFAAAYPVVIEAASVSDFYPSEAQDIGRPGIIDPDFKQIYNPTKVRASNLFLPSTAVNGLSAFEELNQKDFDRADGQIERLVSINNTIVAVMSVREVSNYIGVVTFQQADAGDGVLAIANQYFGTEYPHTKTLGTNLPGSVFINDGQIFGFTSRRANAWRYQGDGESVISDVKMINFFQQLKEDGVSDAMAVYDRRHEEYILTLWRIYQYRTTVGTVSGTSVTILMGATGTNSLPIEGEDVTLQHLEASGWVDYSGTVTTVGNFFGEDVAVIDLGAATIIKPNEQVNLIYSRPETIVWYNGSDETALTNKERWVRLDDRTPDAWCQLGSDIVSFKNGRVWVENTNPIYNNFYGVQYNSKVTPVFNENFDINKVWNALWLSQIQDDKGCDWRSDLITNENGQLSRLNKANFANKEGVFYIDFKRDLNTPNKVNPILNGNRLRSCSLTVELTNDYVGEFMLSWIKANWTASERTTK